MRFIDNPQEQHFTLDVLTEDLHLTIKEAIIPVSDWYNVMLHLKEREN
jgi:hypothetical protein